MQSLEAKPKGLRSWSRLGTNDVAAEGGDHSNHFIESGRLFGNWFLLDGCVDRLPFTRREDDFAVQVRTVSAKATQVENFPGHNRIDGQAVEQSAHSLEVSFLDSATGLERSKVNLNLPANAVVFDDVFNLFCRIDGA